MPPVQAGAFYREHRAIMSALQQAAIVDEAFARRSREMLEPGLEPPGGPLVAASLFTTTLSSAVADWFADPAPAAGEAETIEALTTFLHRGLGG